MSKYELGLSPETKTKLVGWLKDLVAKHHEEKGPFDSMAQFRARTIAILEELSAGSDPVGV